ncbi:MAG: hypothetical protein AB1671_13360 [Thermodesulfobacteriota bacterium]|jgi:hypothetical protein
MTKKAYVATIGGVSVLLAVLHTTTFGGGSAKEYERELLLAELQEQGVVTTRALRDATPGQLWLLARYGEEAYLAGRRYPEAAVTLYLLFGETPEFRAILHDYGYPQVLPVLWYFFHNDSLSFVIRDKIRQGITALKNGLRREEVPAPAQRPLTPAERAWIAVHRIKAEGNDFLGRFVIDREGVAHQVLGDRIFAVTKELLAGNLLALERKYQGGQEITAGDFAWAGTDVALLGLVSAKTFVMLRGGRAVAVAGQGVRAATVARSGKVTGLLSRTATLAPRVYRSSRAIRYGAAGLGVYLLYRHRAAFHAGVGAVADAVGLPRVPFQLAVWAALIALPLWLLSWAVRPAQWIILPVLRRTVAALEGKEPRPKRVRP